MGKPNLVSARTGVNDADVIVWKDLCLFSTSETIHFDRHRKLRNIIRQIKKIR